MKVSVLVETFPSATEVPILNQLCGLIDCGIDLHVYSYSADFSRIHKKYSEYQFENRTTYLPKPFYLKYRFLNRLGLKIQGWIKYIIVYLTDKSLANNCIDKQQFGDNAASLRLLYTAPYFKNLNHDFDIVYCQFGPFGLLASQLKCLGVLKGKIITAFMGYGINVIPNIKSLNYYDKLIEYGSAFTSNTMNTKEGAVKIGFEKDKIHIIHATLDVNDFPFRTRNWEDDATLKVLSVGSLLPVKGHEFAIKAIGKIKNEHPKIKVNYCIVGFGPKESSLKNLVENLSLQEEVEFLGFMDQESLKDTYLSCHIYLHPSIEAEDGSKEAQGLVIQEALATGMPVLATNIGGIPECFVDAKTGFLIEQKSEDAIINGLLKLIANKGEWLKMGKYSRDFVNNEFDIKVQTKRLLHVFNNAMGE